MSQTDGFAPAAVRREAIVSLIEQEGFVRVTRLARHFSVTEVTIRGDLDFLAERHAVQRVHGGAVAGLRPGSLEPPFEQALLHMADEKQRIGRAAAGLVQSHQSVIVDAGTTTTAMARALAHRDDLEGVVVITNALNIALELESETNLSVVVTGGTLRKAQHSLVSPLADAVLERINADLAFVGCNGVEADCGVTNINLPEADVKRQMLNSARRSVILADSSKIGVTELVRVIPATDIDLLITGIDADPDVLAALVELHVAVRKV